MSRMELRLDSTTNSTDRLKILRDVAWFAGIYWTGARGGQLAYTLTSHVRWEEDGDSVTVSHTFGKTLRQTGDTHTYHVRKCAEVDYPL